MVRAGFWKDFYGCIVSPGGGGTAALVAATTGVVWVRGEDGVVWHWLCPIRASPAARSSAVLVFGIGAVE